MDKKLLLIIAGAVAVVFVAGFIIFAQKSSTPTSNTSPSQKQGVDYQTSQKTPLPAGYNLETDSKELDVSNIDQIDKDLNTLNTDTSGL
jgi:hypothetical protein